MKQRYKMYKARKMWVFTAIAFGVLGVSTLSSVTSSANSQKTIRIETKVVAKDGMAYTMQRDVNLVTKNSGAQSTIYGDWQTISEDVTDSPDGVISQTSTPVKGDSHDTSNDQTDSENANSYANQFVNHASDGNDDMSDPSTPVAVSGDNSLSSPQTSTQVNSTSKSTKKTDSQSTTSHVDKKTVNKAKGTKKDNTHTKNNSTSSSNSTAGMIPSQMAHMATSKQKQTVSKYYVRTPKGKKHVLKIRKTVASHKRKTLSDTVKAKKFFLKKNHKYNFKKVVKSGKAYRIELTNGRYITSLRSYSHIIK